MPPILRILLVSGEYPPLEGGVGDYTYILGHEMARQGAQVAVLTSTRVGQEHNDGLVSCLPWIEQWNLYELVPALKRAIRRFQPNFIHIQYQTAAFQLKPAVNLLPSFVRGRYAVTFHDLREPYLFPKAGKLRKWITLKLARSCDVVIVTNDDDRKQLASVEGVKDLTMIPIGSNIAPLSNAEAAVAFRQQVGLGSFQTVLGYFGLINASKGVEELIQALQLVRNTGINAGLLIIGGGIGASDATNAAYLEKIKALITRNGLGPYVRWTGHLVPEQVSAALQCVDIAVLPFQDGVSLRRGSLMAALSHGLPIISTLPPNPIPEITQGETMVLVSAKDVQSLAEAITNVINEPGLRIRLARHAIDLASRFTWPVITRQTLEVMYAALAG